MAPSHGRARGLLLVNLGTPDAPTTSAVRRYLREFLSDPRVINLPAVARWMLLNFVILPRRPSRSAASYQKVWSKAGSPLLVNSRLLAEAVADALVGEFVVALAMRYGQPSIGEALEGFARGGVESVTVLPLYPQYAASSTGSTLARVYALAAEHWDVPPLKVAPPFFDSAGYLDAFTAVSRPVLAEARAEHVLFSFHGLPERQIHKSDPSGTHCLSTATCCDQLGAPAPNGNCYRAQCFHTAHALARRCGLAEGSYTVCFQSRLGRTPWVTPHTDQVLKELPGRGVRRVAVVCPSFVADCLETVEEIGLREAEAFKAAGGDQLTLVPSLNAHPSWVAEVVRLARAASG